MNELIKDSEYKEWIKKIKVSIQKAQIKAAICVNVHLIELYWELGKEISEKQVAAKWGSGFIEQLSGDLKSEFPNIAGFTKRNLEIIRQWYSFYSNSFPIAKQLVSQLNNETIDSIFNCLKNIPWGHNVLIIQKIKDVNEALFYVRQTIENNWSRAVLSLQIESALFERQGKAVTNFVATLPSPQSDLANQLMKDPYNFDFLQMTAKYNERDLEKALTENIVNFLLELGSGFAFVGKQYYIHISNKDYFIDLLFYHIKLRSYVVIELKTVDFEPEFAGKLNFYLSAVDELIKEKSDNPSIGILICKGKDNIIAEYALRDMNKPIGVSGYEFTKFFPENFKGSLPTIEEIEQELFIESDTKY